MAKKVRQKLDEDDPYHHFEFPVFDELKFLAHECEQTGATLVAFLLALVLGAASLGITLVHLPSLLAVVVGLVVVGFTPWIVRRLRAGSDGYTRGEWAGLMLLELFGWLGFWFLLTDLIH